MKLGVPCGFFLWNSRAKKPDFIFRGGATLIIDLRENRLRYVMRKRIDDEDRLQEQRELLASPDGFGFTYLPDEAGSRPREPFAMAHRGQEEAGRPGCGWLLVTFDPWSRRKRRVPDRRSCFGGRYGIDPDVPRAAR